MALPPNFKYKKIVGMGLTTVLIKRPGMKPKIFNFVVQ